MVPSVPLEKSCMLGLQQTRWFHFISHAGTVKCDAMRLPRDATWLTKSLGAMWRPGNNRCVCFSRPINITGVTSPIYTMCLAVPIICGLEISIEVKLLLHHVTVSVNTVRVPSAEAQEEGCVAPSHDGRDN
jgi:hypothetical protein